MAESTLSANTDNSLMSRETESKTSISKSFESQTQISSDLKNHIISSIVANLRSIIEENQQSGRNKYIYKDNLFYSEVLPSISLEQYIRHIFKYTEMDISTLILAVIYIDNFCEKFKYFLTPYNIYRLVLISIYLSIKYNEDIFVNAITYAAIAGVSPDDLRNLEYQMSIALDFAFYVKSEYYELYFNYFSKYSA